MIAHAYGGVCFHTEVGGAETLEQGEGGIIKEPTPKFDQHNTFIAA